MSITLVQDTATSITVLLEDTNLAPVTGLDHTDVTAGLRKDGEGSFTSFVLTAMNFTEIGAGLYEVDLAAGDVDTLGAAYMSFAGASIRTSLVYLYVIADTATPTVAAPTTSILYGYVYDVTGAAVENAAVTARVVGMPITVQSGDDGVGVSMDSVSVLTNGDGYFAMTLLEGATVDITIPAMSYRRTVVVPVSNSNLFDIV